MAGEIGKFQLELLQKLAQKYSKKAFIIALDNDTAGEKMTEKIYNILKNLVKIEIKFPEKYKDWNDYIEKNK
ncbi:MAG: toprim domain-containing protein [Desulfobacterales bacterium]|nr:toprim domain-containing protein [Desulfobacterales bacterium]